MGIHLKEMKMKKGREAKTTNDDGVESSRETRKLACRIHVTIFTN